MTLDFDRWFQQQGRAAPPAPEPESESLADQLEALGLDLHKDGSVWGRCCICDGGIRLTDYMSAEECLRDVDPENQYCGGSPRCCP
jgi:hypothetical protein